MHDPRNDLRHADWLDRIAHHARWLAGAQAELRDAGADAVEQERVIARWTRRGEAELGPDLNLLSLLACLSLPVIPDGTAADARLRRRRALSEAAYGAVLRARAWQEEVLYLCPGADGLTFLRLHCRTLALLEDPDFGGDALEAARWAVSTYIAEAGLEPDLDRPVPSMAEVQRRAFETLSRDVAAWRGLSVSA